MRFALLWILVLIGLLFYGNANSQTVNVLLNGEQLTCEADWVNYSIDKNTLNIAITRQCRNLQEHIDFPSLPQVSDLPTNVFYFGTKFDFVTLNGKGVTNNTIYLNLADTRSECIDSGETVVYCNGLTIFKGSDFRDTEVPGCIGKHTTVPRRCRGGTAKGKEVFSMKFKMKDWGVSKNTASFMKSSTIDTMVDTDQRYATVVAAISTIPGHFDVGPECGRLIPAIENNVIIVQAGTAYAATHLNYCSLSPGTTYYFNTRFEHSKCGVDALCRLQILDRTPL